MQYIYIPSDVSSSKLKGRAKEATYILYAKLIIGLSKFGRSSRRS
jgi:hypothetical protein